MSRVELDPNLETFLHWLGDELDRLELLERTLEEMVGGRPTSEALHAIAADVHLLALNRELEEGEPRPAEVIHISDRRRH